jgi:uncharacterized protein with FMN-binding domain
MRLLNSIYLFIFNRLFILLFVFAVCFGMVSCWKAMVTGGDLSSSQLADGIYTGESAHGPNKAVVRVTIADNRITQIEVLQSRGTKNRRINPVIPDKIIALQSTRVDAVSGATNSSNVLMNAVQDAVGKAMKK